MVTEIDDTDPKWLDAIIKMQRAAKDMPDDFWGVAAVQDLAALLVEIEPLLSLEQCARIVGIGAVMINLGKAEAMAGIRASLALNKAKRQ